MKVSVLGGTGPAGAGLAARLASVGVEVVVGSRQRDRARQTCDEIEQHWPGHHLVLEPADNARAARLGEIVVVATPWDAAAPTVAPLARALRGKVVISMANALARIGDEFEPLASPRGSIAAHVQAVLPGARVAAAFHHLPARALADLSRALDSDVLVCSDHLAATEATSELIRLVPGLRPLDAGSLSSAAPIEAFASVILQLNIRYKARAAVRLTGIDDTR